jgi:hypothetical protein
MGLACARPALPALGVAEMEAEVRDGHHHAAQQSKNPGATRRTEARGRRRIHH